jgi:hypothetical protein
LNTLSSRVVGAVAALTLVAVALADLELARVYL